MKNGKFEKALPPSRLEAESRPDPNAGKTGGQAWGMKSLDALTLVIGRLKTVVDLASDLSKRWHGLRSPTIGDCGGLSLSPH